MRLNLVFFWVVLLSCSMGEAEQNTPAPSPASVLDVQAPEPDTVDEELLLWMQRDTLTAFNATQALDYVKRKSLNSQYAVLMDAGKHSGLRRLHVWDFNADSSIHSALVSHGCGDLPWGADSSKTAPTFSNVDGSHCSSLGRYRIGERGYSNWGINVKYTLHGLDPTNSHAKRRLIVLHGWMAVGDTEVYPDGAPEGWGCPAVSNTSMQFLDSLISSQDQDLLLWLYR